MGGESGGPQAQDLWRGMRGMTVQPSFRKMGGTELAPMSTTSDVRVALQYAQSERSLLFKIKTSSFLQVRGHRCNHHVATT